MMQTPTARHPETRHSAERLSIASGETTMRTQMFLWVVLCLLMLGAPTGFAQLSHTRLLVAEIDETDTLDLRSKTNQQKIEVFRERGYRIIQERETVYAIPPSYFQRYSELAELFGEVDPYREYELGTLPEERSSFIQQIAQAYNRSVSDFSQVVFSMAVEAVFETGRAVYQVNLLPARASRDQLAAFFTGDVEQWKTVANFYSGRLSGGASEMLKDFIKGDRHDKWTLQQGIQEAPKRDAKTTWDTQTKVFFSQSVPSMRLTDEEKASFLARYYLLVQREVAKERERWNKVWQRTFETMLKDRADWEGWTGNEWTGSWEQLPADIRQKISTVLEAEGIADNLRGSRWRLLVVPYLSFIRSEGTGIYSEHYPINPK